MNKTGTEVIKEIVETLTEADREFITNLLTVLLIYKATDNERSNCSSQKDDSSEEPDLLIVDQLIEKFADSIEATGNEGLQDQLEMEWNYWLGVKHGLTGTYTLPDK